ncbi:hypothetical protein N9K45_00185 [bacterium]|jgi:hypothetical protein|nr:hypothetical protein [bacterium]
MPVITEAPIDSLLPDVSLASALKDEGGALFKQVRCDIYSLLHLQN